MPTKTPTKTPTKPRPLVLCELFDTGDRDLETYSPFVLKVRRALAHAGLPFTSERRLAAGSWRDVNPLGQVPILRDGDEVITDSPRILRRLEQLAPERLRPADPEVRAEARLWEAFADQTLYAFVLAARWADDENYARTRQAFFGAVPWLLRSLIAGQTRRGIVRRLVDGDIWRAGPERHWERFRTTLDSLEERAPVEGFWMGECASCADFALFGPLHSLRHPMTPRQRDSIAERPRLSAYLDRLHNRSRPIRLLREAA